MNRNDPQRGDRDQDRAPAVADSEASRRNAKARSEPHLQGRSPQEAHGPAAQDAARYDRDVPVPTNHGSGGDQTAYPERRQ